ncbi:MAG: hypothetical protein WDW36_005549 [Sanguina aurantia]
MLLQILQLRNPAVRAAGLVPGACSGWFCSASEPSHSTSDSVSHSGSEQHDLNTSPSPHLTSSTAVLSHPSLSTHGTNTQTYSATPGHTHPSPAAAPSIYRLQDVTNIRDIADLFLVHHHFLDAAHVERLVMRALQLAAPAPKQRDSTPAPASPAGKLAQPAAVLSTILRYHPPLSVKSVTALLWFFLSHPTLHTPRDHLLTALCAAPRAEGMRFDFAQSGDILSVLGAALSSLRTPERQADRATPSRRTASASLSTAVPPELHRACTEFSTRLAQHIVQLLNHPDSQPPSVGFKGPESLAMMCRGAAQLHIRHPPFWDATAAAVLRGGMTSGSLDACTRITGAFASTGRNSPHLADVLLHVAQLAVCTANQTPRSSTAAPGLLLAFSRARYHHEQLFSVLVSGMTADCGRLTVLDVSSVLLACARVGHDTRQVGTLLRSLAASPAWDRRFASECTHRPAAHMLWSLAVMDLLSGHPALVSQLLHVFKSVNRSAQLAPVAAVQLTQVHASLTRLGISTTGLPSRKVLAAAVAAGIKGAADFMPTSGSPSQSDVFHRLARMIGTHGIVSVQEEGRLVERCVGVDILVVFQGGRKVAVEVDGPTHFLFSDGSMLDGSTRLRNDALAHAVGGRHNLVCLRKEGHHWLNYVSGRSVEGPPEQFLLEELLAGGRSSST